MSTAIDHSQRRIHGPSAGLACALTRFRPGSLLGVAAVLFAQGAFAQSSGQYPSRQILPPTRTVIVKPALGEAPAGVPVYVQPVAHQPVDPRRALDPRIESMPQVDQKMSVIHHRSQLIRTRARVARITFSDPSVIDVVQYSETELSILGLGLGTTDLLMWFENDAEPLKYAVTVIHDPSLDDQRRIDYGKIERKIQILYPNSKVYLIPLSRRVIVRGQARDAEEAANIMQTIRIEVANLEYAGRGFGDDFIDPAAYTGGVNGAVGNGYNNNLLNSFVVDELQVPGEFTVQVRVRIAQLNHEMLRRYGVDLSVILNDGRHVISSSMASAPVIGGIFDNGQVGVLVDALTTNGTGKIIEDASLVTLSGNPAAFLAGGEFAVPTTVGLGGAAAATTSFRGYGTSVIATPTVVDNDLFRLQIVAELSNIDSGNAVGGIPGLNVKRIQTMVEVREGQTLVLGGLYGRQQRAEVTRIPFLGELPIVGHYLFNSKRATEDENELLIVVTPELVRAIDADQQPPLPGFHVTHPDCYDFYKYNRTEGNPDLGHYQMLPYGHGQGYAQDAGYNVFNPAPAIGLGPGQAAGMPAQGSYGAAEMQMQGGYAGGHSVQPGMNGSPYSAPSGQHPGAYGQNPQQPSPTYAPAPVPGGQQPPQFVNPPAVGGPQAYSPSGRGAIQQTSGVRGVPRASGTRRR
jgi:pilus assembly protein CpaC